MQPYTLSTVIPLYSICLLGYVIFYASRLPAATHRCVAELVSASSIALIAYNDVRFIIPMLFTNLINLYSCNHVVIKSTTQALLFFYLHSATIILQGRYPFLAVFPFVLVVGRLVRNYYPETAPKNAKLQNGWPLNPKPKPKNASNFPLNSFFQSWA